MFEYALVPPNSADIIRTEEIEVVVLTRGKTKRSAGGEDSGEKPFDRLSVFVPLPIGLALLLSVFRFSVTVISGKDFEVGSPASPPFSVSSRCVTSFTLFIAAEETGDKVLDGASIERLVEWVRMIF